MNRKFWNWKNQKIQNEEGEPILERILELRGTIAEDSWFDDDVTPGIFKNELNAGCGDVTVWINSPGGDCIAAAEIYNMLREYPGNITVKIDGIAASAASVIAMAGDKVLMSPVSMMMVHNPATGAFGDHTEMQKAMDMLSGVKDSIINAYEIKTGMSRAKLSHLMDAETWMDAGKAIELGFADGVISKKSFEEELEEKDEGPEEKKPKDKMLFSRKAVNQALVNKLEEKFKEPDPKPASEDPEGTKAEYLRNRLILMKKFM